MGLLCTALGCGQDASQTRPPLVRQAPSAQPANPDDGRETYAVYNALLGGSSTPVVIRDQTRAGVTCDDFSSSNDPRLRAAGEDFAKKNGAEHPLNTSAFTLGRKVEMVSSAELDQDFSKGISQGWAAFHERHPQAHGYIDLSAVGFNADKTFAVVYSGGHCGGLCGAGGFATLSKKNGKWQKNSDRLCSWIS